MKLLLKMRWGAIVFCFVAATGYCESSFTSSVKSGPYPWTHTRFLETGNDFHFAVVADRAGGCRSGVFEAAVEKLNLLRPAMVMSVGDYIEGYTDDINTLRTQWAEVDGILKELQPPFFFVPGNHDYCNFGEAQMICDTTAKMWQSLRGPTYYWFIYKNTLFLCLNSMEGENHRWGLGDAQLACAKNVLTTHPNVRWTFVFMHNPLWEETGKEVEKPSRYTELEKILSERNHTVFAGHWHEYSLYKRHGMKYFVLATTGGVANPSAPQWGEFDHIVWVSMTDSGPQFSNLTLNGILADNVCTQAALKLKKSVKFIPAHIDKAVKDTEFSFSFTNTFTSPMKVTMTWKDDVDCSIDPKEKSDIVPSGVTHLSLFRIKFNDTATMTMPKLKCSFNTDKFHAQHDYTPSIDCMGSLWKAKWTKIMTRPVVRVNHAPKIDGKLNDSIWQQPATIDGFSRVDFSGTTDPTTRAWFAYDDKNLYVAWRCSEYDMKGLVAKVDKRDGPIWTDDSVEVFLDATLDHTRYYYFGLNSLGTLYDNLFGSGNNDFNSNAKIAVSRNDDCWMVELAVPWKDMNVQPPQIGTQMGYEITRGRPRGGTAEDTISQFPPLGSANNHQPKLFGILVFGK